MPQIVKEIRKDNDLIYFPSNLSLVKTCKWGKASTERLINNNVKIPEESLLFKVKKVM